MYEAQSTHYEYLLHITLYLKEGNNRRAGNIRYISSRSGHKSVGLTCGHGDEKEEIWHNFQREKHLCVHISLKQYGFSNIEETFNCIIISSYELSVIHKCLYPSSSCVPCSMQDAQYDRTCIVSISLWAACHRDFLVLVTITFAITSYTIEFQLLNLKIKCYKIYHQDAVRQKKLSDLGRSISLFYIISFIFHFSL